MSTREERRAAALPHALARVERGAETTHVYTETEHRRALEARYAMRPDGPVAKLAEAADMVQDTYEHALHLDDRDLNVGVCVLRTTLSAVREALK